MVLLLVQNISMGGDVKEAALNLDKMDKRK